MSSDQMQTNSDVPASDSFDLWGLGVGLRVQGPQPICPLRFPTMNACLAEGNEWFASVLVQPLLVSLPGKYQCFHNLGFALSLDM